VTGPRMALLAALVMLAGCAGSPQSSFYTLSATAAAVPPSTASTYGVSIGPVSVPETVDRPQITLQVSANQVEIDEFHRWAEPLAGGIARTVAANLRGLLGTARIAAAPGFTGGEPVYQVALNVVRFESKLGDSATVDVLWAIGRGGDEAPARSGHSTVVQPAGGGYDALVAAHSRALAQVSGDIASAIRSLAGGG